MLWLSRPPILRWFLAGALAVVALMIEFSPEPTAPVRIAVSDIEAGSPIDDLNSEIEQLPLVGLISAETGEIAVVDIPAGHPIAETMTTTVTPPPGWGVITAPVPPGAVPGESALAIILPDIRGGSAASVPAIVASIAASSSFGDPGTGSIAVPTDHIEAVAVATAEGRITVAMTP